MSTGSPICMKCFIKKRAYGPPFSINYASTVPPVMSRYGICIFIPPKGRSWVDRGITGNEW